MGHSAVGRAFHDDINPSPHGPCRIELDCGPAAATHACTPRMLPIKYSRTSEHRGDSTQAALMMLRSLLHLHCSHYNKLNVQICLLLQVQQACQHVYQSQQHADHAQCITSAVPHRTVIALERHHWHWRSAGPLCYQLQYSRGSLSSSP